MATSVSTVGLIGAGKIANALVRGFLAVDGLITPDRITAAAPHTDKIRVREQSVASAVLNHELPETRHQCDEQQHRSSQEQ